MRADSHGAVPVGGVRGGTAGDGCSSVGGMSETAPSDNLKEYQRRAALWAKAQTAARDAARACLSENEALQIDALAGGNKAGFFETFLQWVVDPVVAKR